MLPRKYPGKEKLVNFNIPFYLFGIKIVDCSKYLRQANKKHSICSTSFFGRHIKLSCNEDLIVASIAEQAF